MTDQSREPAPLSAKEHRALSAELDRREAEADAAPEAGVTWAAIRDELRARLR